MIRLSNSSLVFTLALLPIMLSGTAFASEPVILADPTAAIDQAWTHTEFGDPTDYNLVTSEGRAAILASGLGTASALFRDVTYNLSDYPWLEWSWRADQLQETADIRIKAKHDFAASIFLIFESKTLLRRNPRTLGYVWTNDLIAAEEMVVSPYHRGNTRMFVLQSGSENLGKWVSERRNVVADYRAAFGEDPPDSVLVLEVFSDSDQTNEPVKTYYGEISAQSE